MKGSRSKGLATWLQTSPAAYISVVLEETPHHHHQMDHHSLLREGPINLCFHTKQCEEEQQVAHSIPLSYYIKSMVQTQKMETIY